MKSKMKMKQPSEEELYCCVEVRVVSASGLRKVAWAGQNNPVVVAWADNARQPRSTRVVVNGGSNPTWEERLLVPIFRYPPHHHHNYNQLLDDALRDSVLRVQVQHECLGPVLLCRRCCRTPIGTAVVPLVDIPWDANYLPVSSSVVPISYPLRSPYLGQPSGFINLVVTLPSSGRVNTDSSGSSGTVPFGQEFMSGSDDLLMTPVNKSFSGKPPLPPKVPVVPVLPNISSSPPDIISKPHHPVPVVPIPPNISSSPPDNTSKPHHHPSSTSSSDSDSDHKHKHKHTEGIVTPAPPPSTINPNNKLPEPSLSEPAAISSDDKLPKTSPSVPAVIPTELSTSKPTSHMALTGDHRCRLSDLMSSAEGSSSTKNAHLVSPDHINQPRLKAYIDDIASLPLPVPPQDHASFVPLSYYTGTTASGADHPQTLAPIHLTAPASSSEFIPHNPADTTSFSDRPLPPVEPKAPASSSDFIPHSIDDTHSKTTYGHHILPTIEPNPPAFSSDLILHHTEDHQDILPPVQPIAPPSSSDFIPHGVNKIDGGSVAISEQIVPQPTALTPSSASSGIEIRAPSKNRSRFWFSSKSKHHDESSPVAPPSSTPYPDDRMIPRPVAPVSVAGTIATAAAAAAELVPASSNSQIRHPPDQPPTRSHGHLPAPYHDKLLPQPVAPLADFKSKPLTSYPDDQIIPRSAAPAFAAGVIDSAAASEQIPASSSKQVSCPQKSDQPPPDLQPASYHDQLLPQPVAPFPGFATAPKLAETSRDPVPQPVAPDAAFKSNDGSAAISDQTIPIRAPSKTRSRFWLPSMSKHHDDQMIPIPVPPVASAATELIPASSSDQVPCQSISDQPPSISHSNIPASYHDQHLPQPVAPFADLKTAPWLPETSREQTTQPLTPDVALKTTSQKLPESSATEPVSSTQTYIPDLSTLPSPKSPAEVMVAVPDNIPYPTAPYNNNIANAVPVRSDHKVPLAPPLGLPSLISPSLPSGLLATTASDGPKPDVLLRSKQTIPPPPSSIERPNRLPSDQSIIPRSSRCSCSMDMSQELDSYYNIMNEDYLSHDSLYHDHLMSPTTLYNKTPAEFYIEPNIQGYCICHHEYNIYPQIPTALRCLAETQMTFLCVNTSASYLLLLNRETMFCFKHFRNDRKTN